MKVDLTCGKVTESRAGDVISNFSFLNMTENKKKSILLVSVRSSPTDLHLINLIADMTGYT